jgi:hypothetical protein
MWRRSLHTPLRPFIYGHNYNYMQIHRRPHSKCADVTIWVFQTASLTIFSGPSPVTATPNRQITCTAKATRLCKIILYPNTLFSATFSLFQSSPPIRLELQASTRLLWLPCMKILLNPWRTQGLLIGICQPRLAHEEDSLYMATDLGGRWLDVPKREAWRVKHEAQKRS